MRASSIAGLVIGCLVLGGAFGFVAGSSKEHGKFFKYWADDCRADGGSVQMTETNRVECFKDGEIINWVN